MSKGPPWTKQQSNFTAYLFSSFDKPMYFHTFLPKISPVLNSSIYSDVQRCFNPITPSPSTPRSETPLRRKDLGEYSRNVTTTIACSDTPYERPRRNSSPVPLPRFHKFPRRFQNKTTPRQPNGAVLSPSLKHTCDCRADKFALDGKRNEGGEEKSGMTETAVRSPLISWENQSGKQYQRASVTLENSPIGDLFPFVVRALGSRTGNSIDKQRAKFLASPHIGPPKRLFF